MDFRITIFSSPLSVCSVFLRLPVTVGVCAEVAALLALSNSTSNQAKFMQPSSNWQQARQFWQHAVERNLR
jgi:hypothetical protein